MIVFTASFVLYTLFIVAVGLYSARFARRSDEDYFLAGRSLSPWVAALSASASSESGWVTLGLVGMAYASGAQAYWMIPGCLVGFMFNWFVLAGRMRDRSAALGAVTLPDFFARHFAERLPILRIASVIVILVAMTLYVSAQFAAAGEAFRASFGIEYGWGVLIGAGIVLGYTVIGGFRAACWTDFVQGLVMVGTLVGFPIYLLVSQGGYGWVADQVGSTFTSITPQATGIALLGFLLGSGALGVNFGYPGQPHVVVRFMALRSARDAKIAGVLSCLWGICVLWGAATVGILVRGIAMSQGDAPEPWVQQLGDGETGLVLAAQHLIPGVLAGMVLAAVLSAICSTADSQLVVAASSVANDLYTRFTGSSRGRSHQFINRTVLATLGLVAVGLVIRQEVRIFEYVLDYGWAVLGASFGPQLILTLLWRRASYAGCVAGMVTGFSVAILWKLVMNNSVTIAEVVIDGARTTETVQVYNLPLAFIAAMFVNIVVSLMTGPRADADDAPPQSSP